MVARLYRSFRALALITLGLGCLTVGQVAQAQYFPAQPARPNGAGAPPQRDPRQQAPAQRDPRYAQNTPAGAPRQAAPPQVDPRRPIQRVENRNPGQRPMPQLPAPFQLKPAEEKYLNEVLDAWQKTTGGIKTFKSDFTRWEYDPVWATGENKGKALSIATGRVLYAKPDKGTFRVDEIKRIDLPSGEYKTSKQEVGEHWVCNGQIIWEFNSKEKLVVERTLPPEMQGKAISGGPLPFLFGVQAPKLKDRYYLRVITPQELAEKEVWIEARPRYQMDATNFRMAVLILKRNNFHPFAVRLSEPSGQKYTTYQFTDITIDDPFEWFKRDFAEPSVPFGWKKIKEAIPSSQPSRTAAGPAPRSR